MTNILFPYGMQGIQQKTFKVVTAALDFNVPVKLNALGEVIKATKWDEAIGISMPDEAREAEDGATQYAVDDLADVALKGPVYKLRCGSSGVSAGGFVTLDSLGLLTDTTYATSGTGNSWVLVGIALQAGASGERIEIMGKP